MNITALSVGIVLLMFLFLTNDNLSIHILFVLANLWLMLACFLTHIKCK